MSVTGTISVTISHRAVMWFISAGLSVWRVHRAQEAPGFGQQLADSRGSHLGKRCPSVYAAEVGEVADEIQLVPHHTETAVLQHAQP